MHFFTPHTAVIQQHLHEPPTVDKCKGIVEVAQVHKASLFSFVFETCFVFLIAMLSFFSAFVLNKVCFVYVNFDEL